ncbi:glycosyltransferase [Lacticaseibacillus paracasei]|uniref:glycosyltransferase n=1 Tax=Lacticaseibacillus paracasei TaxID=1597 RepID=UPI00124BC2F6|nr:glycosyltransferase [Lacticaseibacillus paracasei]KAB1963444.1 glycosyltransferase [Lacticaseibacillus paracasei]MCT3330709.1 glycosyltransferase [Lacticaseibacillus paracasei]
MNCKLTISIIIPVYNAGTCIDRCLSSIISQLNKESEVILIDDGSTDGSGIKCDAWEQRDTRIKVVHTTNMGVSHARNIGINLANGDWVLFVDIDDYIFPQYFEVLANIMNQRVDYIFFSYLRKKICKKDLDKTILNRLSAKSQKLNVEEALKSIFIDRRIQGYVWNKAFKKEIIQKFNIHFFEDIHYNEDLIFCYEYLQHSKQIIYSGDQLYCYVNHEKSAVTQKLNASQLECSRSFGYMLNMGTDISKISRPYIHVAYLSMNCYLLKSALRRGYSDISLVHRLRKNIISEKFTYFRLYNFEDKILTILIHAIPLAFFNVIYRLFPDGIFLVIRKR